jgi:hypothetical protein
MMGRFRRFLNDSELKEIYLHGRCYTWSNEQEEIYLHGRSYTWSNDQEVPTLVRLDRVFVTVGCEELQSSCSLRCLAKMAADHFPLILDCSLQPVGRNSSNSSNFG